MRIVFLSAYSGIVYRGVETYVHELASHLSVHHEVFVLGAKQPSRRVRYNFLACSLPPPTTSQVHPSHKLSHYLFLDTQSRYILRFSSWAARELIALKPDIVIPTNNGWQTLLAKITAKKLGSKIVVSSQSGLGRIGPGFDEWINTLMGIDMYVLLTNTARSRLKSFAPWQKTVVIPNGVNLSQFHPRARPTTLSLPQPIVMTVSALEPTKRIDLIIRAVSQLKHPASLLVLGDGQPNYKAVIENLATQALPGRFLVTTTSHHNMPSIYRSAQVFTLASEPSEAFGISIIEAMASGIPVVVTDDSQRREIMGGVGYLVNPRNIAEFSTTIEKALKDHRIAQYRKQASKFSWETIADQYDRLFTSLVS